MTRVRGLFGSFGAPVGFLIVGLWALGFSPAPALALDPEKRLTQYTPRSWLSEDGLPQNSIFDIAQTPEGYLWVGTTGGLTRFDGVRFEVFTRANTEQLVTDQIYALATDPAGSLWIGTNGGGLLRYREGAFERFTEADGLPGSRISALAVSGEDTMCIGTYDRGFATWRPTREEAPTIVELPDGVIFGMAGDGEGGCWVGVLGGGLHHVTSAGARSLTVADGLASPAVWGVHRGRDGNLWIGTDRGLTVLRDGEMETFTTADGLSSNRVKTVLEDRDGNVWVGTQGGGLNRGNAGRFETLTDHPASAGQVVWSLFEDVEGSVWVGTLSVGLHQLADRPFVTWSVAEGLTSRQIHSLLEDEEGALWFTSNSGLHRFQGGTVERWLSADGLSSDTGWALIRDREDHLWIGTTPGAVDRFDLVRRQALSPASTGLGRGQILALLEDRQGAIWVGSGSGLSRTADGEVRRFTDADGLPHSRVEALLEDQTGRLWVGTLGGLSYFDGTRFSTYDVEDGLPNNRVRSLYEDDDGTIWIGTFGGGLARLRDGQMVSFSTLDGLFSDSLTGIVEDDMGFLWLSSTRGLSRVAKADLDAFADGRQPRIVSHSFGRYDGLKSSECLSWQPTSLKARDGSLWFATMDGLATIDPAALEPAPPPRVLLQDALVDGVSIGGEPTPEVPPGSRSISFRFAAATLLAPEKIRFRYRIQGLDQDWNESGAFRTAVYARPRPGRYVFEVMASDELGRFTGEPEVFAFTVRPRFTQTPAFVALSALALVALGYGVQFMRVRRLRRRQAELDQIAREAVARVKVLSGLLPICASCKKIRDDAGYWNELEVFIDQHSEASFSHGLCPSCVARYREDRVDFKAPAEDRGLGPP